MKHLLLASTFLAGIAALPFEAYAANPDSWTGATSNAWENSANWSASTGVPTSTSAVTISNLTKNPVQLNSNVSLNTTSGTNVGSLTVGTGVAPGTANVLNINSGYTLTMGTHAVTLAGGSITGPGTLSSTGAVTGFGTISSQIVGTGFTANATNGTNFGSFLPFVNGTPGTPITLIGQNLPSDSFTVSNHGDFNFQGVTLTTPTLSGVSTNLNAGSVGGNNYYGLFNFTGAASTVVGNVNNTNYQQFNVTGTTLHLNNFSLTNSFATNVPPFFVIGAGGTLDNSVGNSNLTGHMSVVLNGGAITNTGGGTFTAPGNITGTGNVSGLTLASGGITASGGTLTVNGGAGMSAVSAGWGTAGGVNDVLDLKGTINFIAAGGFPAAPGLYPSNGTVQLDGATINTAGGTGTLFSSSGNLIAASGVNTVNGAFIPNGSNSTVPNVTVQNGATLNLQSNNALNAAINANNVTLAQTSVLNVSGLNNTIALAGNYSTQQTDAVHALSYDGTSGLGPDLTMNAGTNAVPKTLATAQTLEVGGIDMGYVPAGFLSNFALDRLTIGQNAYVELVDQFDNATQSGWSSGNEALYITNDALFDGVVTGSSNIPTLNLNGIDAYLQGYGQLVNGLFTDSQNHQINIIGVRARVPEPTTIAILGIGLTGLGIARRQRRNQAA